MSALHASFPVAVVTASGHGQAIALVIDEEGTGVHEHKFILDRPLNPSTYGKDVLNRYNATRRPDQPRQRLLEVKTVPLREAGTHIFKWLDQRDSKGELFRCSGCGMMIHGRPSERYRRGAPNDGHAPYDLVPSYAESRRYYSSCHVLSTEPTS
jgi:hypothetical protein